MATEILVTGTVAADSTDVVVAAGTPVTIFLKAAASSPVDSRARCDVKIKASGATFHKVGELTGLDPARVIDGPGTYRVSRVDTGASIGVDRE